MHVHDEHKVLRPMIRLPHPRARTAAVLFAVLMAISLAQGWTLYSALGSQASDLFVFFVSGAIAVWCALPVVQTVVINAPRPADHYFRFAGLHLLGYLSFALLAHTVSRTLSSWLLAMFGFNHPRGSFFGDLVEEADTSASVYAAIALLWTSFDLAARQRAAELRALQTETVLAQFELERIHVRMSPLRLNTLLSQVREAMRHDVKHAASLLEQLGIQLRAAFSGELLTTSVPPIPESTVESASLPSVPLSHPARPWRRPRVTPRQATFALFICLLLAFLTTASLRATQPAQNTGFYASILCARALGLWLALPVTYTSVLNRPDPRQGWLGYLGLQLLVAAPLFCLVMTSVEYAVATTLAGWLGATLPPLGWWEASLIIFQHASNFMFASLAFWSAVCFWARAREEEQRAAALSGQLAARRLEALTARLEPHFLYNALNTVNALMHLDRPLAGHLLDSLDQLLIAAYTEGATWTLLEERAHAERYIAFVEARFGDRITVQWNVADQLGPLVLPRFAVQQLIENAIKHNQEEPGALHISVEGQQGPDSVSLLVTDSGRGFPRQSRQRTGGLVRLEQVLTILHGDAARLVRLSSATGGACVELTLPWTTARQSASPRPAARAVPA